MGGKVSSEWRNDVATQIWRVKMAQIAVTKVHEPAAESHSVLADLNSLADRIRERAYSIFESRGSSHGEALDHWLEAERDLTINPESDLVEKDSTFELNLALEGFSADDLAVMALPGALIVTGTMKNERSTNEDGLSGFEATAKTLCSRFDLPVAINVDQVTARLDNGVLRVTARKAALITESAEKRSAAREKATSAKTAAA
jgi:HSP20 family molecular chaperone IbpA